jgi:hypothetical protein
VRRSQGSKSNIELLNLFQQTFFGIFCHFLTPFMICGVNFGPLTTLLYAYDHLYFFECVSLGNWGSRSVHLSTYVIQSLYKTLYCPDTIRATKKIEDCADAHLDNAYNANKTVGRGKIYSPINCLAVCLSRPLFKLWKEIFANWQLGGRR